MSLDSLTDSNNIFDSTVILSRYTEMEKQCITIHPYFEVQADKIAEFKAIWNSIVPVVATEPKCLFYEFTFNGNIAFCREGYEDSDGVLQHFGNVSETLGKVNRRRSRKHISQISLSK